MGSPQARGHYAAREFPRSASHLTRLKFPAIIPDLDTYRTANLLIKQHVQNAPIEAAMRADAMLDKGGLDGYGVWKRIPRAVEELLSKERPVGMTVR